MRVEGLQELEAKLKTLAPAVRDKIMKQAMSKAGKIVRDEARRRAPKGSNNKTLFGKPMPSGRLDRSIGFKFTETKLDSVDGSVLVNKKGKSVMDGGVTYLAAYYAQFIEFGHYWVAVVGRGRKRIVLGYYPPNPFMAPAGEAKQKEFAEVFRDDIRKKIYKLAKV